MFNRLSLRQKLTGIIVLLVIVTLFVSGYLSYDLRKKNLEDKYLKNINSLADLKANTVEDLVKRGQSNIEYLSNLDIFSQSTSESMEDVGTGLDMMDSGFDEGGDDDLTMMMFGGGEETESVDYSSDLNPLAELLDVSSIIVTKTDGAVVFATNEATKKDNIREYVKGFNSEVIQESKEETSFSDAYQRDNKVFVLVGGPVGGQANAENLVFVELDVTNIIGDLNNDLGLGSTAGVVIAQNLGPSAIYINNLKSDSSTAFLRVIDVDSISLKNSKKDQAVRFAAMGNNGSGSSTDYYSREILASWRYIPEINWAIVVKINKSELEDEAVGAVFKFGIFGLLILALAVGLSYLVSQYFVNPLLNLRDSLSSLSKGILPEKIEKKYNDEVGQMAETTNELVQGLKRTASFAEQIGQGKLGAEFTPLSDSDNLGSALLNMRNNLLENEKRDKERNWIVTGIAEISEILRSHDTINELGDAVIAYITEKIVAVQGAFYVISEEDAGESFLEMKAVYAYNKKKYLNGKFRYAEGLVGQVAAEKAGIIRTEIPDDYVTITSGLLGEQRPKCILVTPMITEEKVYGVLEFAGIHKFSEMQVKFVEEISVIIARTIFNIRVNERTRRLLEESQKMSNELQEKQEVLRQNAEEMEATQEELKRTNQKLEEQIEEVNRTQTRMQLLLENASEVIAIYEEEGTIRYISPSVHKILGYGQDDLIGTNDIKFVDSAHKDQFIKMFEDIKANPFETVTIQYEYLKKGGETVWLEATATNLLSDKSIQGIIVNSRDITERRRAEQEERMRSKMQSLSENSPDLITRLDHEGNVFYINPVIETYTGQSPADILNQNLSSINIPDELKENWLNLLKQVEVEKDTVATEMDFPSQMGDRVMQVNAIPEFDEANVMESVLVVSHDITERKLIELEIQSKNKKITESINYAKRIQGAILPNNNIIRKFLPDSFMLYKARDVVSGDFPWFVRVKDIIYYAAVDCTGHGVPGALISLIGYFLLNEIVKGRKISDPGEILDKLDQSVTQTLRQDSDDSKTKDGMDIALCRIDLNTNELTYAGAHRPLYYYNGEDLEEIKGDKFPIGGGVYKNQTNFTSTTLKMKKGQSVFYCSDGFPDQFGGPDNRKFGPRRIRDLITEHAGKNMDEMYKIFDDSWEEWKGDTKQTDDVLLIGIRF